MKKIFIATVLLLIGEFVTAQTLEGNRLMAASQKKSEKNRTQKSNMNLVFSQPEKIWMWSHSNLGQGNTVAYNFISGQKYQITFKVKASSNIAKPNASVLNATMNVKATTGVVASNAAYSIPASSENTEIIWSSRAAKKWNKWKTVTVEFTASNSNNQLWFYPVMTANANDNGGARIQMEVKEVSVTPMTVSYAANPTAETAMTMN